MSDRRRIQTCLRHAIPPVGTLSRIVREPSGIDFFAFLLTGDPGQALSALCS